MKILRSIDSGDKPLLPPRWEITFISYLLVAIQARDARIACLEQFDYQKAVALDDLRRRAERRVAA